MKAAAPTDNDSIHSPNIFGLIGLILACCGVSNASTVSTFDVLVATETLTVVGTTTLQGYAFSVGISSLVVNQGNVGIGTTTPSALLHLVAAPIQGNGAQFKWIASSGSLRSGEVSGTQWDPSNIGLFSVAFGFNNQASGSNSNVCGGGNNAANSIYSAIGGGFTNSASGAYSVISGGAGNFTTFNYSAVGGGESNSATNAYVFIGGGQLNSSNGDYVTIGGGYGNTAAAGGIVCGGGYDGSQKIGNNAGGGASAVVGGLNNNITGSSAYSFIGGGKTNLISNGARSVISGGESNTISGSYATVPGGTQNTASGNYSFAAGRQSSATAQGSFVWADSQNFPFISSNSDEFKVRAQGGFVLYSTWTASTVIVSSGSILISTSATAATAVPNIFISSTNGNVGIGTNSPGSTLDVSGAATIRAQETVTSTLTVQGNTFSVGGSSFTLSGGTGTIAYALTVGALYSTGSITASSGTFTQIGTGNYALALSTSITFTQSSGNGLGIRWGDGTISTTASSGASNSTWFFASSQTFTAVTSFAVGLPASTNSDWTCDLNFTQNTSAGLITGYFNNDTGSNYSGCYFGANSAGTINNCVNPSPGNTKFQISDANNGVKAGQKMTAHLDISAIGTTTGMVGQSTWVDVNSNYSAVSLGAQYSAAAANSLYVKTSAGTMTGTINCAKN